MSITSEGMVSLECRKVFRNGLQGIEHLCGQIKKVSYLGLLCLLANTALSEDIEVKNAPSKRYQKEFDELVQRGYRPIKVWAKTLQVIDYVDGEKPSFGYWATFRKVPNGAPWVAFHGLDAAAYQQEFEKWAGQGYMPTDLNVAAVNNVVRYNVIYDKVTNPPAWVSRHNIDRKEFDREHKKLLSEGFKLKLRSAASTRTGWVYAALWRKD